MCCDIIRSKTQIFLYLVDKFLDEVEIFAKLLHLTCKRIGLEKGEALRLRDLEGKKGKKRKRGVSWEYRFATCIIA